MTHCSVLFTELKLFWPRIVLKINRTVRYMILRMCRPIFSLGLPSTLPSVLFSKAHHCGDQTQSCWTDKGRLWKPFSLIVYPSVSLSTKHTIQPQGFVPAELHVIGVTGHTCNQGPMNNPLPLSRPTVHPFCPCSRHSRGFVWDPSGPLWGDSCPPLFTRTASEVADALSRG